MTTGLQLAKNDRQQGARQPGDIISYRRATSSRNQRATSSESAVAVPWFADRYREGADWRALAWWIHDHLPYSQLQFFPKLAAFNIGWHERPRRRIDSFIAPKDCLTRPGMANHDGSHAEFYPGFPRLRAG